MKAKTFDCIRMKEECQRVCQEAYGGLPLEERRKKMISEILANPVLGEIYRQTFLPDGLDAAYRSAVHVAETGAADDVKEQLT